MDKHNILFSVFGLIILIIAAYLLYDWHTKQVATASVKSATTAAGVTANGIRTGANPNYIVPGAVAAGVKAGTNNNNSQATTNMILAGLGGLLGNIDFSGLGGGGGGSTTSIDTSIDTTIQPGAQAAADQTVYIAPTDTTQADVSAVSATDQTATILDGNSALSTDSLGGGAFSFG